MKRDILLMVATIIIVGCTACMFNGCGVNSTVATDTDMAVDTTATGGSVDTGDVSVSGVTTNIEARYTFAELVSDILSDWFWRTLLVIAGIFIWWDWRNGNLHPAKPKHIKEK